MRTVSAFNAPATPIAAVPRQVPVAGGAHSAWHSPVPYLFGGLAAMLGLIAFALLILACSYWKLSGYLDGGADGEGDVESGGGKPSDDSNKKAQPVYEERIVVIMAGDEKPTFLATPISSRASSFADHGSDGKSGNGDGVVDGKKTEREAEGESEGTENLTRNGDQNSQNQGQ